jgi:uncharacterized protein
MVYNVAGLLRAHSGETRVLPFEAWPELDEPDVVLLEPLQGELHLTRDHNGVLVQGQLRTRLETACARCLAPAVSAVELVLSEHFRPTVFLPGGPAVEPDAEAEPATDIDERHQVDLTEVVRQALLLALPLHPLCRPDCRGLCARCGQDLNEGPCGCQAEPDPRWQALSQWLDEAAGG